MPRTTTKATGTQTMLPRGHGAHPPDPSTIDPANLEAQNDGDHPQLLLRVSRRLKSADGSRAKGCRRYSAGLRRVGKFSRVATSSVARVARGRVARVHREMRGDCEYASARFVRVVNQLTRPG